MTWSNCDPQQDVTSKNGILVFPPKKNMVIHTASPMFLILIDWAWESVSFWCFWSLDGIKMTLYSSGISNLVGPSMTDKDPKSYSRLVEIYQNLAKSQGSTSTPQNPLRHVKCPRLGYLERPEKRDLCKQWQWLKNKMGDTPKSSMFIHFNRIFHTPMTVETPQSFTQISQLLKTGQQRHAHRTGTPCKSLLKRYKMW